MSFPSAIHKTWLNEAEFTDEEKQILNNYSEEEINFLFIDKDFEFGTAGIRKLMGPNPQSWNIHTYRRMAQGYSGFIKEKYKNGSVLVTHDNRKNGELFSKTIAEVLSANGITVYMSPNNISIPTPVVSYYVKKLGLSGAINVTASHNPAEYNGFKTYNHTGCQTNKEEEDLIIKHSPKLKDIFQIKHNTDSKYQELPFDFLQQYFDEIKQNLPEIKDCEKNIKVLFSSHHGTSSKIMKLFANQLGFLNFEEYEPECNPGCLFNEGENVNPEEIDSFSSMKIYAEKNNFNYLIAHDPDSDRMAIVEKGKDGVWHMFNGNEMSILLVHFLLKNKKNEEKKYIVSTFVSGNFVKKLAPNIPIYLTKTGFKNISQEVEKHEKESSLLIAFEEAIGALLFPINREKDAFQQSAIMLLFIANLSKENKTCKNVLEKLFEECGHWIGITNYFLSTSKNWYEELKEKFEKISKHPIQNMFGYEIKKIFYNIESDSVDWYIDDDNWIKFRISGTEPKFKTYYNLYGKSKSELEKTVIEFKNYFKKYLNF